MKKFRILSFLLCLLTLFGACSALPASVDYDNTVTMLNVGQASCTLIESGGRFCLIDAAKYGGDTDIVSYLSERDVKKIDLLVLTHFHYDHTSHAMDVIRNFDIGTVLIPSLSQENIPDSYLYKSLLEDAANGYYTLAYATEGMQFAIGDGVLTVAADTYNSENINNTSTVAVFTHDDFTYVNMADTEQDREEYIAHLLPADIDFLTAGHHGSDDATSQLLLDRLNPSAVGISCSETNEYGHPHKSMLARLENMDIPYYITYETGNIVFDIDTLSVVSE